MVVTVLTWVVIAISMFLLMIMFRPLESSSSTMFGDGFEAMFRLAYLIPLLALWLIYFAVRFFIGA